MTAFMAGGVGADACSVLLACSGEARALTGSSNCRPAGRSGAEYNGSEFARAVGLPVIACSADGALLTTISSKWRVLHAEPCLLPPQSSGLQLGSEGSPARTPGSRRDRVGFYTLSRLEDSVLCPIPSSHHPPAGRQRLEPRSLC